MGKDLKDFKCSFCHKRSQVVIIGGEYICVNCNKKQDKIEVNNFFVEDRDPVEYRLNENRKVTYRAKLGELYVKFVHTQLDCVNFAKRSGDAADLDMSKVDWLKYNVKGIEIYEVTKTENYKKII